MVISSIEDAQNHAKRWLFDSAAPLWSSAGVLADGMFAERINLDGSPAKELSRRLRVQARQIYSFVTIGSLGWDGPWEEISNRAVDILVGKGLNERGLFVHLFDKSGNVASEALDLYDHAFGLFALAHASRALDRPELMEVSHFIRDIMMKNWWRDEGGFWEGELTPCPPFRQNPHMHMFEAALVSHDVTGDVRWRELVLRLRELFQNKFQDYRSGAVTEYFDANWMRVDSSDGKIVEPGHCFEWAWLFEVGGVEGAATSDALTHFARSYGINQNVGVAINEVYLDGTIRDSGARLWPQTERLKAAIARFKRTAKEEEKAEIIAAYRGLCLYLDVPVKGLWRDRLNADGGWVCEAAPASSFYHIICALNELIRL